MNTKYAGKLDVARISSTKAEDDEMIFIDLKDDLSRTQVIRIQINVQELMLALTGRGARPCSFTIDASKVGYEKQMKREKVLVPNTPANKSSETLGREAIAKFEVDGWAGNVGDTMNFHRIVERKKNGNVYNVLFERWVKVAPQA